MKLHRAVKVLLIVLCCLVIIGACAGGVYIAMRHSGYKELTDDTAKPTLPSDSTDDLETGSDFEWTPADVYHNGKRYRYRDELISVLLIGVDKESKDAKASQADALYLAVFDKDNNKVNLIAISRNTYATLELYDVAGNSFGEDNRQLCLAYSFGKDDAQGSELTVKAVSRLFYNLPIQGYYTIFEDEVATIVDTVGGVTLTLSNDMTSISKDMIAGATVTLNSKTALSYLRWREETNAVRVNNQMLFIKAFAGQLKEKLKTDPLIAVNLFNKLSDISVTNISSSSLLYLMTSALGAETGPVQNIEGRSDVLNGTEVVYLDNTSLYGLILDQFYEEIN